MGSNSTYKWLVSGGAFFCLIAFFLAFFNFNILSIPIGVSLSTLAGLGGQSILFLMPLGLIAIVVFSLIPTRDELQGKNNLIMVLVAWIISILVIAIALISLYSRIKQGAQFMDYLSTFAGQELLGTGDLGSSLDLLSLTPGIGLFLYVIGNIAIIIGLIMAWNEMGNIQEYPPVTFGRGEEETLPPEPEYTRRRSRSNSRITKPKTQAWFTGTDGRNYQLNQGHTRVGRLPENDIRLDEDTVSKRHALIEEQNGHFRITDLASTNGTWLNGRKLREPTLLHPNDEIRFGSSYKVHFIAQSK